MSATAAPPKEAKQGGKKKLVIIVAVVLIAAGAGGWFSGIIPGLLHGKQGAQAAEGHGETRAAGNGGGGHGKEGEGAASANATGPIFVDVPEMIANLNNGGRRAAYIKLKAKLELARKEDIPIVQNAMPRVTDLFQGYLREMRPEELRGTAGTYRLREELVARTNIAAAPAKVVSVLLVELLVQ